MISVDTYKNTVLPAPVDVIELAIPIAPKAIQSVRFSARAGYVQTFQPKANKEWKLAVKNAVFDQLPQGWQKFTDVPLWASVLYVFPPLTSFKKNAKKHIAEGRVIYKHTKPDVNDNLNKGLFDALTGVLWDDDSRIAHSEATKVFGKEPGIVIKVGRLPE